jgi:SAM-dependent methyltransferase
MQAKSISTILSKTTSKPRYLVDKRRVRLEKFEQVKTCPVCFSSSLSLLRKGTFDPSLLSKDQIKITDSDYGKIWNLSRCDRCTHVFANPCPSFDVIQSLYSEIEDPLYQEEEKGRSKNFIRIFSTLEKMRPEKGTLFDVGAATGILLDIAGKRGWEIDGIEPSTWAVNVAKDRYHVELQKGTFENAPLPDNRYAAVTMVDFIEHVPHPNNAISKAHKILSNSGILCLVTPDINSLAARIMGGKWWHFRPAHLGFFTKKSLDCLLHRNGFHTVKRKKYSWTFSAYYLLSRRPRWKFLLKNSAIASLWKKITVKLALQDSIEIYAKKDG